MRIVFYLLVLATTSACLDDPNRRSDLFEPTVPAVDPSCFGTPLTRGAALRKAVEGADAGATILLGPCEYLVVDSSRHGYEYRDTVLYNSGIRIEDSSGLSIVGAGRGRTTVNLARSVYMGFEIRSNTTDLTITDLTIVGSIHEPLCEQSPQYAVCYGGPSSPDPRTHAIGSPDRTRGVRGVTLARLEIRDVAVAISVGGGQCGYIGTTIADNYLHDIRGTYAGSGYGILIGCATGVTVRNNLIVRAGRHSIYQAWTPRYNPDPVVIVGNTIVDHGHEEPRDVRWTAIAVARSDNINVIDNTLVGGHAYGISVEYDPDTGLDCTRCLVAGNTFLNADAPEDVWINAHSPVWTWGNVRDQARPVIVRDDSGLRDEVARPGSFWAGTQAIAMSTASTGVAHLYVMQDGVLHMVAPDYGVSPVLGWREARHSTNELSDFVGMTANDGQVYVWQGQALHAISPEWTNGVWAYTEAAGWRGPGAITSAGDGFLYVIQDGALNRVDPTGWTTVIWDGGWNSLYGLAGGGGWLYAQDAGGVYELEIGPGSSPGRIRTLD